MSLGTDRYSTYIARKDMLAPRRITRDVRNEPHWRDTRQSSIIPIQGYDWAYIAGIGAVVAAGVVYRIVKAAKAPSNRKAKKK